MPAINASFPFPPEGPGQIKVGSLLALAQEITYSFDPVRGTIYKARYDAALSQNGYRFWQDCVVQGIAADAHFHEGHCVIEAVDSTQTYSIDSWGMGSSDEQLSVWLNPIIVADLNANVVGGSYTAIPLLQASLQNNEDADTAFGIVDASPPSSGPFVNYPDNGATLLLYPQIQQGVTDYRNAQTGEGYVLRHKTNIPNTSQDFTSSFGVGMIYTTAQLLSEINNNALWNYPCPTYLQYFIAHITPPPVQNNSTIGWFKDRSTYETAANNRIDIVTEYTYVQASNSLYYPYNGLT